MKKITFLLFLVICISALVLLTGTAVLAAEQVISFSGEELNNGEEVGGDTGGASYVDAEGGYRTMIHGVNTGVRPIKNYYADIFSPDGQDIVIRYRVKILADDGSTAESTRVFGFYPILRGDGTTINREAEDALFFTAGELRAMEKEENGWFYVYYVAENERFSLSEYDVIEINNQVYYNGAKGSGCAVDIAVAEIAVFLGDPRVSDGEPGSSEDSSSDTVPESTPESTPEPTPESTPALPDTSDTPGTDDPATTDPADSSSNASDNGGRAEESNLPLYISGGVVLLVLCLALVLVFLPVFAENPGDELIWRMSGTELNRSGTGGAGFEEKDGYGYRTLLHGVNTGVHPIYGLKTDLVETNGDSFVLVLKAKVLSDDGTTEDQTNVFGLDKYIKDADGKTLAGENDYCVRFTAGDVRNAEKDADGWSLFFCTVSPEQYGEGESVSFDCEIYFNGVKNSGCAIDIAVTELSLYRQAAAPGTTEPEETEPEETEPEETEPEETEPEETEPEETEPEETEPEETEPEETEPEETEPEETEPEETEPEETEPEETEPEETEPEEPMNPYPPVGEFPPKNTANLSGYGFATSDSYEGEGTIAVTAVDGDILDASRWIPSVPVVLDPATGRYRNAAGKYAWLKIEFEIPTAVSGARIYWAVERAYENGYRLYYSNDNENWSEIAYTAFTRGDGNGSVQSPCVDTILFEEVTARYFCIRITEGMTADGLGSIYEFELYGDPAQYAFLDRGEPGAAGDSGDTGDSDETATPDTTDSLPMTPDTEPTPSNPGSDGEEKAGHTKLILSIIGGVLLSAALLLATFFASRKIKKDHIVKGLSMLLVFATLFASLSLSGSALRVSALSDGAGDSEDTGSAASAIEVREEETVREGWLLEGIPSYEGGTLSKRLYNAGPGLASDSVSVTSEDSYMQIIAKTTGEEFLAYLDKLESLGYKSTYRGSREENLYAEYEGGGRRLYAYYIESLKTARVIDERTGVSLDSFSYSLPSGESAELYQYGLYQASPSLTTTNCGMLYVIKLADNSLFIVDGGHQYQSSDLAVDGFMEFLHEITGTEKGERVTIAAWFITHAHADHLMLAAKVLHRYHSEIDLERVMFNFPSFQVVTSGYRAFPTTWFKHIVTTYYSNAVFLKPHTGMRFDLGNMNIEVLFTHEDGVRYASPSVCSISNFNSTSTVLKFTFGEDKTFLLLGDADTEAEALLLGMYEEDATFKSDVLQVAHHSFNYMRTLYPKIAPSLALVPNSKSNAHSSENLPKIQPVIDSAGADNVYYEGSGTYGFAVVEGEWKLIYEKKLVSSRYDGSGF